jgi:hypothetical protein
MDLHRTNDLISSRVGIAIEYRDHNAVAVDGAESEFAHVSKTLSKEVSGCPLKANLIRSFYATKGKKIAGISSAIEGCAAGKFG